MTRLLISVALFLFAELSAHDYMQHSKRAGVTVGSSSISIANQIRTYTIAGASFEYFPLTNLALGLGYRGWFGATPSIHQPQLFTTYYLDAFKKVNPYGGLIYQRNIVETRDDFNEYGYRIGLTLQSTQATTISIGWVELYHDATYLRDASNGYSEIVFGASF